MSGCAGVRRLILVPRFSLLVKAQTLQTIESSHSCTYGLIATSAFPHRSDVLI